MAKMILKQRWENHRMPTQKQFTKEEWDKKKNKMTTFRLGSNIINYVILFLVLCCGVYVVAHDDNMLAKWCGALLTTATFFFVKDYHFE